MIDRLPRYNYQDMDEGGNQWCDPDDVEKLEEKLSKASNIDFACGAIMGIIVGIILAMMTIFTGESTAANHNKDHTNRRNLVID